MSTSTESGESPEPGPISEPAGTPGQQTLGHDEFDPVGTLVLIFLYFLTLILMWVFTYFIEFLGNEPTPMLV